MSTRKLTAAAILEIDAKAIQLKETPDAPKFENHSFCVGYAISCIMRASHKSKDEKVLKLRKETKTAYYTYYNRGRRDGPLPESIREDINKPCSCAGDIESIKWPPDWTLDQSELDWSTGTPFMEVALQQMSS